ncbi:hypothetical protein JMJ77_0000438 [Colletotrichum scovillei]|uniref:Uncharacterized protein n=1 Tax=Colletotrichum scovillei TaxID=1209932 RepID=A0A9P7UE72_9PEZI|nr:hypothetical protein JMJ77_0000438 [Colletotrichum scovillei]KAG7079920.1 hypothetical protein JMJ78_0007023 [Colletotrichum scovillei]
MSQATPMTSILRM